MIGLFWMDAAQFMQNMIDRQASIDRAVRNAYAQYPISIPCKHCHCDSCQAAWVNLAGPFTAIVRAEFRKLMGAA